MLFRQIITTAKKELKRVAQYTNSEMALQAHLDFLSDDIWTLISEAGSITVSDDSDSE